MAKARRAEIRVPRATVATTATVHGLSARTVANVASVARGTCNSAFFEPQVLRPFDRREGCSIEEAAEIAGKAVRTMRGWAEQHHLARRVGGGHWIFSRVALQMLLDGDEVALATYLRGDRSSPIVVTYYEREGLGDLISRWRSFASAKAAILT